VLIGKTQYIESFDGITIAYEIHGNGDVPLVFIHGWCCDRSYWKNQIDYFKDKFKVVLVDLAGHGDSEKGRENYTIQNFAKDVMAVNSELNLDKCILIGHSLGGYVVLETAKQNTDNIFAIFPVDSYPRIPERKSTKEIDEILVKNRKRFENDFEVSVNKYVRNMFVKQSDSLLVSWVAHDMSTNDSKVGIDANANLWKYYLTDFENSLSLIDGIPVIHIGSLSKPIIDDFKKIHEEFDTIQMVGVGHFVMMEDPTTFNNRLDSRLHELLSKSKF
jgi:pimeloyl-ACP methyl ester carboxylesterase